MNKMTSVIYGGSGFNLFRDMIHKKNRTIKIPDEVPFYEVYNTLSIDDFKESKVIQDIKDNGSKDLKFGVFSNKKVPKYLNYRTLSFSDEEKENIINRKEMVQNNFECYLIPFDYYSRREEMALLLTNDSETYYVVEVSHIELIRDMSRENGMYNITNNKIEGNFKYCLFDGKDYRILSKESLAYKDVESELNDRAR